MATLKWRVPHGRINEVRLLLAEAEECEAKGDQHRLREVCRRLELMPGFSRHFEPGDHFLAEEAPKLYTGTGPMPGLPH